MRRILIFSLAVIFYNQLPAQDSGSSGLKIGETTGMSLLLEAGTAYLPDQTDLNVRTGRPSTLNLYVYRPVQIAGKYFMFKPGIGLGLDNFFFEKDVAFSPLGDSVYIAARDFEKSKLSANYIDIPLEFRIATSSNPGKGFKLEFGGKVGVLFSGHSKVKYEENDVTVKAKVSENMLNRFRYGLTGRIGYRRVIFFTYYSLSPLFREDFTPEVQPLIFGITFSSL